MKKVRLSQPQTIALGFFIIIFTGTLLLMLPISTRTRECAGLLPALFTATSASCVTGLIMRDTYSFWSGFGQAVIISLIQLGGLGFMTVATFFSLGLKRKIGVRERELMSESINSEHIGGIVRLTKKILIGTFCIELTGAVLLAFKFCPMFGFWEGIWNAVFHSISAFCNAGFDIMGKFGEFSSLSYFADDWYVNIIIMLLIIIGGIGFLVWDDLWLNRWHWKRYHLHTKIVLSVTAVLVFGGALGFFILEGPASDGKLATRIVTSLFDSVTARTAGFNTTDTGAYTTGAKLLTIMLMFIGGSPGSTAGGIKTTTVAVLVLYSFSYIRKEKEYGIFGRRLEHDSLQKASAVFFTNLSLALAAAIIICGQQSMMKLEDILFEVFSAIGTAGMTTGITRDMTPLSSVVLIFLMYCGRVGSISFATALSEKKSNPPVRDPVEKITIG